MGNVLQYLPTAEGYAARQGSSYTYVYQYKDHLGNVRLSYSRDPQTGLARIVEENNYYPYGLQHSGYNNDVWLNQANTEGQKITFNSRELQNEFDLFVVAMDFRQYDPALGRFTAMDRLAAFAPGITPYRFAFNNPNYWSDPTGLFEGVLAYCPTCPDTPEFQPFINDPDFLYIYDKETNSIAKEFVLDGLTLTGGSSGGGGSDGGGFIGGWGSLFSPFGNIFTASELSTLATIGGGFSGALEARALENSKKVYKYGTKTTHRDVLTKQNKARMDKIGTRAKIAGRVFSFGSIAITGYQYYSGEISGTEATIDAIMGGIGFIPGWGTAISVTYFAGKGLYEYFSGETLFEKPN